MQDLPVHLCELFDHVVPIFSFLLSHDDNVSIRVSRTSRIYIDNCISTRDIFRRIGSFESLETAEAAFRHTATPFDLYHVRLRSCLEVVIW